MSCQLIESTRVDADTDTDTFDVAFDRVRPVAQPRGLKVALRWPRLSRRTLLELGGFLLLAVAYNLVRSAPSTNAAIAFAHAQSVLDMEGWLFSRIEIPLNDWLVSSTPLAVAACYVYALLHYVATPVVFFLSRRRGGWQYWRGYWALIIASAIALVGYALYPTAPPRLVADLGMIDVMRHFAEYGWWGSAASAPRGIGDATNQFAAMPSMHCGWALWCGWQLWGFKSRAWRIVAVAYPTVLVFVVLATANHFLLDAVAGAACVVLAYGVVQLIGKARGRTDRDPSARDMRAITTRPV